MNQDTQLPVSQESRPPVDQDVQRQVIADVEALRDIFSEFEQRLFINYCHYRREGQDQDKAVFSLQERYHTLEYNQIRPTIDHILAGIQAHNPFLWDYLQANDYDLSFFPRKAFWSPEHDSFMRRLWWVWLAGFGALLVIGLFLAFSR
ncbi:MAG: hypothetical protein KJ621_01825 [Proteobacteria bacterium]|nr:hypothetical protein [Pseudomonadota bacterium]